MSYPCYSVDYSARDFEVVDYENYELPGIPRVLFRGPTVDTAKPSTFFTCIGAAQTLGVYVQRAFPEILGDRIGLPAWNAGVGGAGPAFFLEHPEILEQANRGCFAVVQVMAARMESNSRFSATPFANMLKDERHGDVVGTQVVWQRIIDEEAERLPTYLAESQASWIENYKRLFAMIEVPTILFWISPAKLNRMINLAGPMVGESIEFTPHLVDGGMLDTIRPLADYFVACHSARDHGHNLISRFTGEVTRVDYSKLAAGALPHLESTNPYYPSPAMHMDAAEALAEIAGGLFPKL